MSEMDERTIGAEEELPTEASEATEASEVAAESSEAKAAEAEAEAATTEAEAESEAAQPEAAGEKPAEEAAEGEGEKPKKKKTGWVIGLIALTLALGGGYYYYSTYMNPASGVQDEPAAKVDMPDLIYESAEVAQQVLAENGIEADVIYVSSEKVPKGLVTLQSVSAGETVDGDVVIYVSLGPAPTPTPEPSPLPTPTPKVTPRPKRTAVPEIVVPTPVEAPCG